MLGNLRILNHQTFSKDDMKADFFDFNTKCLSMSFLIPKKIFVKNHISTEWIYVEIEDFEIDAMEFENFTDPTENNIQLTIHPTKYFILDSAGKTVRNIPELEKLVIEIHDESRKKKTFLDNVYARYKNRTKINDDATTKGDDESLISFETYNTDFCNNSMIEQVKNRNLSINTSFQEIDPTTIKQNRIMNIFNTSPHKQDFANTDKYESEDLYSSIDYGRRHENAVFQLEKNVQKVRPMQEKPPKRDALLVEPFISSNISVPVFTNKRVVKLPQLTRTEALRQDVFNVREDDGPIVPYKSFISQEREKKKQLLKISSAQEEIIPDSEDFTLEDDINVDDDYIYPVQKQSSTKKVQVKKLPAPRISAKPARKRSNQTRSKKNTAKQNNEALPNKEVMLNPESSSKLPAKTRNLSVKPTNSRIVLNDTKSLKNNARKAIFISSSEDSSQQNKNNKNDDYISDLDMNDVIHPKAPSEAIVSLMAAKKKRDEMKKKQENPTIIKTRNSGLVKKSLTVPVKIEKKTTEPKQKVSVNRISSKQKSPVVNIENIDPVQNVKNITLCAIVSPGSSRYYHDEQYFVEKVLRKSKRMADVDEIIEYHEAMEVNNLQNENDPKIQKAMNLKKRDLSVEDDNRHFKHLKLSTPTDYQNLTYDRPINYNFDQLKNNKLLSSFISEANNNDDDNEQQQHYQKSVTVQRTTTIQKRFSIDQSPINKIQIKNPSGIIVGKEDYWFYFYKMILILILPSFFFFYRK